MRYYRLSILKNGRPISINIGGINTTLGPFDTSKTPSYGQQIEFDILIQGWDVASSDTVISIFGLPVEMLDQAVNLSNCQLTLEAGFQAGLPLANPNQSGTIFLGNIVRAYSNFLNTHQSLVMMCGTQQFDQVLSSFPIKPITLRGKENDKLADVILTALNNAYPEYKVQVSISSELILTEKVEGIYSRGLRQFAIMLRSLSKGLNQNAEYNGVRLTIESGVIKIWDNSQQVIEKSKDIEININEIIGQPSWLDVATISIKLPLRADIRIADIISINPTLYGNASKLIVDTIKATPLFRKNLSFSGNFQVISIRHIGQYLNADANNAWVTVIEAAVAPNSISIPLPEGVSRPPRGANIKA